MRLRTGGGNGALSGGRWVFGGTGGGTGLPLDGGGAGGAFAEGSGPKGTATGLVGSFL